MIKRIVAVLATLGLMLAAMVALPPGSSEAAGARTTIVVSPHPDDEVLRAAGYMGWAAGDRGDKVIVLAVTDGGGTGMGKRDGLTTKEVTNRRSAEQAGAVHRLTYGTGDIYRAGLTDGQISSSAVARHINILLGQNPGAEVYCAAHSTDDTRDHRETAKGCRDSGASVVRYIKDPRWQTGCTDKIYPYEYRAVEDAYSNYWWSLGPTSYVGSIRNAAIAEGYSTCYTRNY